MTRITVKCPECGYVKNTTGKLYWICPKCHEARPIDETAVGNIDRKGKEKKRDEIKLNTVKEDDKKQPKNDNDNGKEELETLEIPDKKEKKTTGKVYNPDKIKKSKNVGGKMSQKVKCSECGEVVDADAQFCPNCGAEFD